MSRAVRAGSVAPEPEVGAAADALAALRVRGACFRPELAPLTGRLPAEVDEGLWDLVARGLVTADAFSAVRRAALRPRPLADPDGAETVRAAGAPPGACRERHRRGTMVAPARTRGARRAGGRRRRALAGQRGTGRGGGPPAAPALGRRRLGAVGRESFKVPWREVVWALRRMEARGSRSEAASSRDCRVSSTRSPKPSKSCGRRAAVAARASRWSWPGPTRST